MKNKKFKNDIKLNLINYFDKIKSIIDAKAQKVLLNLTDVNDQNRRREVLEINQQLIDKCDSVLDANIRQVNKYFDNLENENADEFTQSEDELKRRILNGYCIFFDNDEIKDRKLASKNTIGILIVTDFYLDWSQQTYLSEKFTTYTMMDMHYIFKIDKKLMDLIAIMADDYQPENSQVKLSAQFIEDISKKLIRLRLPATYSLDVNLFSSFGQLKELIFSPNRRDTLRINRNHFIGLKNLEMLDIRFNIILELEDTVFSHLSNLKSLRLHSSKIQVLNNNSFANLFNLEELFLSENEIKVLNPNTFKHLENLKKLHLESNKIKEIDENLFTHLTSLEELDLSFNQIEALPPKTFKDLLKLKRLDLCGNNLKDFNDFLKELKYLKVLSISSNTINSIKGDTFAYQENLLDLSIHLPKLKELRKNMMNGLKNLKSLKIDTTNYRAYLYESLDDRFRKYTPIESKVFSDLVNLDECIVSENFFTILLYSEEFYGLPTKCKLKQYF